MIESMKGDRTHIVHFMPFYQKEATLVTSWDYAKKEVLRKGPILQRKTLIPRSGWGGGGGGGGGEAGKVFPCRMDPFLERGQAVLTICLPRKCMIIGIRHGFSCINIRQVPWEVLKPEAEGNSITYYFSFALARNVRFFFRTIVEAKLAEARVLVQEYYFHS